MAGNIIVVKASRDMDAGVWFVETCDVPGLNLEAETLEELVEKLPGAILDLLGKDGFGGNDQFDVPVELVAHASTRILRMATV